MKKTLRKTIKRKLIKFQNEFGKKIGRTAWSRWKMENGYQ